MQYRGEKEVSGDWTLQCTMLFGAPAPIVDNDPDAW